MKTKGETHQLEDIAKSLLDDPEFIKDVEKSSRKLTELSVEDLLKPFTL
ncbi:MAG: hypothetical protein ACLFUV_08090 [Methanomassiliicoccales archaeon]